VKARVENDGLFISMRSNDCAVKLPGGETPWPSYLLDASSPSGHCAYFECSGRMSLTGTLAVWSADLHPGLETSVLFGC
jgi:hypothetical protein